MKKIRTIIVDDEPLALRLLSAKLEKHSCIELIATCANGREAVNAVLELTPDLLFLDIQMPGLSGLDVIKQLQNDVMPLVIFTTAYEQYALEAFDANAVDYILKPIESERITRAVERVKERLQLSPEQEKNNKTEVIEAIAQIEQEHGKTITWFADDTPDRESQSANLKNRKIVIKDRDEIHLLKQEDIQWIDAAGDYVCVHALGDTHVKRCTLKEMLEDLDENQFKRVHRSTIVNLNFIDKVIPHTKGEFFLMMGEHDKIKVSRNYKDVVKVFLTS